MSSASISVTSEPVGELGQSVEMALKLHRDFDDPLELRVTRSVKMGCHRCNGVLAGLQIHRVKED